MFGFKKKENKRLLIMGKDLMDIIYSDYEDGMSFTLAEFVYEQEHYLIGSLVVPPEAEEKKENIVFAFQDKAYEDFYQFEENACIDGVKISQLDKPIEIVRAGIVGNDTMLSSPWGETRLAKKALPL